ncbi:MAG TPA: hypothetical protein PLF40_11085 [Kofleriaceae bacterium]|nr:hypothetical protein [Kofleriaceae bacterium]
MIVAAVTLAQRQAALPSPSDDQPSFASTVPLRTGRCHRLATSTLIGEPTGGNQRGINGGELTWLTLPSSGIAVDIPLIAWVADDDAPNSGVTPTVAAPRTVTDLRAGRDTALQAAIKYLQ